jgi:hypothetical protein
VYKVLPLILLAPIILSCSRREETAQNGKIAEAYNKPLYSSETPDLGAAVTHADSVTSFKNYSLEWASQQVFLRKAKDHLSMAAQKQIDEKVNHYRASLYRHEYERALIAQKMDTAVRRSELDSLLEQFSGSFLLEEDIVQFIAIVDPDPKALPHLRQLIKKKAYTELEKYCSNKMLLFQIQPGTWTPIETLYSIFPGAPVNSFQNDDVRYLSANGKRYLLQLIDHKKQGTVAPSSYVTDELRTALLQSKKARFIEQLKAEMLRDAIKKNKVKLYQ